LGLFCFIYGIKLEILVFICYNIGTIEDILTRFKMVEKYPKALLGGAKAKGVIAKS
jgi:hypothetical protein